jgi:hypothetical protein
MATKIIFISVLGKNINYSLNWGLFTGYWGRNYEQDLLGVIAIDKRRENECRDVAMLRLLGFGQRIIKFGRCLIHIFPSPQINNLLCYNQPQRSPV